MAPLSPRDTRDLELKRELQEAFDAYVNAAEPNKQNAKGEYLKLLQAFSNGVMRK